MTNTQESPNEKQIKTIIDGEFRAVGKYSTGTSTNVRLLRKSIEKIQQSLTNLESLVITRVNGIRDAERKAECYDHWAEYRDSKQLLLDDAWKAYAEVSGEPAPADLLTVPANHMKEELRNMIPVQVELIEHEIGDFRTRLTAATANQAQLNQSQYRSFSTWLERIRSMIWPYLEDSTRELTKLDPVNVGVHINSLKEYMRKLSPMFRELEATFTTVNISEDAFAAGAAARPHSTINNLTLGATAARTYPLELYGYGAGDGAGAPPDFHGDVREYARWRKEWQGPISQGRSEEWLLRKVVEHLKMSDPTIRESAKLCKTMNKVWELLDSTYANPVVVSQRVIKVYTQLSKADLEGTTPEAKLVSLDTHTRQLLQRLEQVNEEDQLKNSISMITHGISLMSPFLQSEFCSKRMKAEDDAKASHEAFRGPQLFNLFTDFMRDKVRQYREYQPERLSGRSSEDKKSATKGNLSRNARVGDGPKSDVDSPDTSEEEVEDL